MPTDSAKKLLRRVKRASRALREGSRMLEFIQQPRRRALLIEGVEEGVPPVSKISEELIEEFGDEVKPMPVKQFVGMAVKAVLAEEGFELEDTGVQIYDDPLFRSGATYSRADEDDVNDGELLRGVVLKLATLPAPQRRRLRELFDLHLSN